MDLGPWRKEKTRKLSKKSGKKVQKPASRLAARAPRLDTVGPVSRYKIQGRVEGFAAKSAGWKRPVAMKVVFAHMRRAGEAEEEKRSRPSHYEEGGPGHNVEGQEEGCAGQGEEG
jgi:hypothetical protein